MKKIILIIFLLICEYSLANTKILTIVSVNNYPITNIDIENEIKIIKIINPNLDHNTKFQEIAIESLINEILKKREIIENNIESNEQFVKKKFYETINQINKIILTDSLEKIIYKKVKLEIDWNKYIYKKFSWKVNINIDEIENQISKENKKNNEEDFQKYKDSLINAEKNIKLNIYGVNYLELLKKNAVIKYYK